MKRNSHNQIESNVEIFQSSNRRFHAAITNRQTNRPISRQTNQLTKLMNNPLHGTVRTDLLNRFDLFFVTDTKRRTDLPVAINR